MQDGVVLLLVGVLGQVLALRILAIQSARSPDDPPILRPRARAVDPARRRRRQQRVTQAAIGGFTVSTALAAVGLVLMLRP